jgi:pimeloyl-ACP methyl ester carboxylesterase
MVVLRSETVETRVGDIVVHRGGAGPPILYLHSAQGEGESLLFLERLADERTVVAPVFPGFGGSEGAEHIDDVDDAVFHLIDVWGRLALGRVPIVGLSLGGWMAVELAVRSPELVQALILVNPTGLWVPGHPVGTLAGRSPSELAALMFHDQGHPVAQAMHALAGLGSLAAELSDRVERVGEGSSDIADVAATTAAPARVPWDTSLHDPKLAQRLWRVACPTLVVHAVEDRVIPRAHAERYVLGITGAGFVDVPDAGHMLAWEKPDDLAFEVLDFLAGSKLD